MESTTDEGDGADKFHWNNRWLAKHGYYVLSYTGGSGPPAEDATSATPRQGSVSAPNGTIHLKSRDYEIRDTQWRPPCRGRVHGRDPDR